MISQLQGGGKPHQLDMFGALAQTLGWRLKILEF